MPAISKITARGQTTVPQEMRAALKSKPGHLIAWEIEPNGRVAVCRIQPLDVEYPQAIQGTLCEWNTFLSFAGIVTTPRLVTVRVVFIIRRLGGALS